MDKNKLIGVLLIAAMFIAMLIYNGRQLEQQKWEEVASNEVVENKPSNNALNLVDTAHTNVETSTPDSNKIESQKQQQFGAFAISATPNKMQFTIENNVFKLAFSSRGGQLSSVELKEYDGYNKQKVELINQEWANINYIIPLAGRSQVVYSDDLYFELASKTAHEIILEAKSSNGGKIEHVYRIEDDSYLIDGSLNFIDLGQVIDPGISSIDVNWKNAPYPLEKSLEVERRYSSIYYSLVDGSVENLNLTKEDVEEKVNERVNWVSYKQQFFNVSLISTNKFSGIKMNSNFIAEDSNYVKQYETRLSVPYSARTDNSIDLNIYAGPNDYKLLKSFDNGLENVIQLSADFFLFKWTSIINKWLIIPIFDWLDGKIGSYGIIILLLTLLIKTALFPLTFKSYKSQAKMKVLKPELDELKEKYKDDQQKMGTAQMQLYQKAGVNPLGGCLPMLLQMPILIAMYYFFPSSIELRGESFLWATDLSTYDSILNLPFSIPLYGAHVSGFTLLMAVTSILYARVNMQMNTQTAQGMEFMKYMPYIFPIFLVFIFNQWAAALTYYYFLQNLISFGQQIAIKRFFIDEKKLRAQIDENQKKPKKKNKFLERLEAVQREQQKQRDGKTRKGRRSNK